MEDLRLEVNRWIRETDVFDYVWDAERPVRAKNRKGIYFREGLHQGDHLHPSRKGGRIMADAFDLKKLTGK